MEKFSSSAVYPGDSLSSPAGPRRVAAFDALRYLSRRQYKGSMFSSAMRKTVRRRSFESAAYGMNRTQNDGRRKAEGMRRSRKDGGRTRRKERRRTDTRLDQPTATKLLDVDPVRRFPRNVAALAFARDSQVRYLSSEIRLIPVDSLPPFYSLSTFAGREKLTPLAFRKPRFYPLFSLGTHRDSTCANSIVCANVFHSFFPPSLWSVSCNLERNRQFETSRKI